MELKEVSYRGFGRKGDGRVVYTVLDNQVFFSGITLPRESTSTINAVESIISAICEAEALDWKTTTFYDIRTHRGYYKPVGFCEVNLITLASELGDQEKPFVLNWEVIEADDFPQEVWELFGPLID